MSDKDKFGSGFLLGTIVGGIVGGIIATVIANKNNENQSNFDNESPIKPRRYSMMDDEEEVENRRLSLEEKINQLNHAIDDVRVTLLKNTETVDNN
jgi:Na+/glutamate symporter